MNIKRVGTLVLSMLIAFVAIQSGFCGSAQEDQATDTGRPFELSIMCRYGGANYPLLDNVVFSELEKATNTDIEWTYVPSGSYAEKFNVALASRSLPMVSMVVNRSATNLVDAVRAGAFWIAGDFGYPQEYPNH